MKSFDPPITVLDPDWISGYKRANVQAELAKCYVAVSEIDHDLKAWAEELWPTRSAVRVKTARELSA